jgi:hypothetical protein
MGEHRQRNRAKAEKHSEKYREPEPHLTPLKQKCAGRNRTQPPHSVPSLAELCLI